MNVLIGGAWPYANGSLYIGHVAALLPGDILARYFRLKKYNVCYVSGSDCHGTPIQIRANKEGVTPEEITNHYHPDTIRYFLIANGPEKRDGDFSWREFIKSHNGELLGAYGNFVNRSLVFIQKSFDGIVPEGQCNSEISKTLYELYITVGELVEHV